MASRSTKPAWQNTWLWKTLAKRAATRGNYHASELLPTMEQWMKRLDAVLQKGGTAPLDFTLHDAGHALRVAHRMDDLLTGPVRRNLSDYELALLLLAAYGHDIGMTPERGKVTAHHRHLFQPDQSALNPEEISAFRKYLDESAGQPISLPLTSSLADLNLADELITHYIRERHNDWSAEWLRQNLSQPGDSFGHLPGVVETLVRLCTSHHLDVRKLGNSRFDPILTPGPKPQLIHLRHLACILRLADILENDPERTPAVLLRHRSIEERSRSLVHWQKDHALAIDLRGDRLHFQARPHTAVAHRALLQLKEWIDHELHGIAAFGERLPAENKVGKDLIRRDWHLAPACTQDIRPADDSYEYIDGAFRPDTGRLLQLLSGEQLYGDPLHAVRELLQNAFDAVREKIARKRLDLPNPADRKWEETLGNQEHVALTLRPGPHGGWQLVCEDSGVGLTRDIINNNVLISGTGRRHAIRQLERDCAEKGFHPGLTGQFGIGVLSYFMLADEVTLETTRYQGCGDSVENWHFTTRGVGSFGELKKLPTTTFPAGGTRVTWGLNGKATKDGKIAEQLLDYLKETLVRIPCRFDFRVESPSGSVTEWSRAVGWVRTQEDCLTLIMNKWLEPENGPSIWGTYTMMFKNRELPDFDLAISRYPVDLALARSSLRGEFIELELPDHAGVVRLLLAYFELPAGRKLMLPGYFYPVTPCVSTSDRVAWRGIWMTENGDLTGDVIGEEGSLTGYRSQNKVSMDIDLVALKESTISVNRGKLSIPFVRLKEWREWLEQKRAPWIESVLSATQ